MERAASFRDMEMQLVSSGMGIEHAQEVQPLGESQDGTHHDVDVAPFLSSLLDALADRPFVQSVDLETEAIVVRGRVLLEQDRFLQVYFNEETGTTAFALIEEEQRIWGVGYDDLRGGT